jgi:adenylate kinase
MIIFTGVAGSGKSLQGKLLADTCGYPWLSTGEFLRMVISGERRKHMLEGKLLEDDEIIAVVHKIFAMVDTRQEFVLDGFPRTTGQAQWLLDLVSNEETYISVVIHLTASKEVVEQRLLNRGRTDDHKEAIDERLHEYEQNIKPILTTFVSEGINVKEVDAERSKEEVHQDVLKIVQSEGQ